MKMRFLPCQQTLVIRALANPSGEGCRLLQQQNLKLTLPALLSDHKHELRHLHNSGSLHACH